MVRVPVLDVATVRVSALVAALALGLLAGCAGNDSSQVVVGPPGVVGPPDPVVAPPEAVLVWRGAWHILPPASAQPPVERWRIPIRDNYQVYDVSADGNDLVLDDKPAPDAQSHIRGIATATGKTVWSIDSPVSEYSNGPTVQTTGPRGVLISTNNEQSAVLDPATGRLIWAGQDWEPDGQVGNLLMLTGPNSGRDIMAIDVGTGVMRWRQPGPSEEPDGIVTPLCVKIK